MLAGGEVSPQVSMESSNVWRSSLNRLLLVGAAGATRARCGLHCWVGVRSQETELESIAYRHDHDRRHLQHLIGRAELDHQPLFMALERQVDQEAGESDGVIVFDPSGFPKKGMNSVGVARQWCGRWESPKLSGRVLSPIATWFLARSSEGDKHTPAITVPQICEGIACCYERPTNATRHRRSPRTNPAEASITRNHVTANYLHG